MTQLFTLKKYKAEQKKSILLCLILCAICGAAFAQTSNCLPITKSYYEGNELAYQQTNTYTAKGLLIKKSEQFLKTTFGDYTQEEAYEYDAKGNVIATTKLLNGKFDKKTTREYSVDNQLIKELVSLKENEIPFVSFISSNGENATFSSDGVSNKTSQSKDKNGNLLKEIVFGSNGKPMINLENQYNDSNKIALKIRTDLAANNTRKTAYTYNTKGNLIEETTTINDEPFMRDVSEYDTKGNLIKKTTYNKYGDEDYVLTYAYTTTNLLSEESYYYNKELISKKTITYDTKGNVTRRDTYERGTLVNYALTTYDCK